MADEPLADPAPSPSGTDPVAPPVVDPATTPVETAGEKPADPAVAKDEKAQTPEVVIPEKYEFKAPDGMALDEPLLKAVEPVFKELKLSQEAATKLFDTYNKAVQAAEVQREADFKTWMSNQTKQNLAAIKAEWGASHDANLAIAQRGMARVFSPAAKAILDETGLGNNPEFVKAFYQVGKMVSEDTPPNASTPTVRKSLGSKLYGDAQQSN